MDHNHIAAIGYCFGGTTVLELARSGAPVVGVVSFHGGLDSPSPEDGKNIKGKVLVLHGANDPAVKAADIAAFQEELPNGNVDWQMIYYGDAVHSFTKPQGGLTNLKGMRTTKRLTSGLGKLGSFFSERFSGTLRPNDRDRSDLH